MSIGKGLLEIELLFFFGVISYKSKWLLLSFLAGIFSFTALQVVIQKISAFSFLVPLLFINLVAGFLLYAVFMIGGFYSNLCWFVPLLNKCCLSAEIRFYHLSSPMIRLYYNDFILGSTLIPQLSSYIGDAAAAAPNKHSTHKNQASEAEDTRVYQGSQVWVKLGQKRAI